MEDYHQPNNYQPYRQRPAMEVNYGRVASAVIGVCIAAFVLELVLPDFMVKYFALQGMSVGLRPWTLVTHIFLHSGVYHIFMNLFGIFLFGFMLERWVGGRTFAIVFFGAGILGGIGQLFFSSPEIYGLGASGGLFGILGMVAVLKPKMIIYVNFIPVPMAVAAVGWAIFSASMAGAQTGIGHGAHLFGLLFGVGMGFWFRYWKRGFGKGGFRKRRPAPRQTPGLQVYRQL